jgi:hypothetical protein
MAVKYALCALLQILFLNRRTFLDGCFGSVTHRIDLLDGKPAFHSPRAAPRRAGFPARFSPMSLAANAIGLMLY